MDGNVLGLDRWRKYVGAAYRNTRTDMVLPIGYLLNDESLLFHFGDVLQRYKITEVVIWYPKQHKDAQQAIDALIKQLLFIEENLIFHKVDEEYSSVEAGAKKNDFNKDEQEDTLVAMILLEQRKDAPLRAEKSEKTQ